MLPMSREESLRLIGGVSLGRVVFTSRALPAIRPVNHLVDDGNVIIRTDLGAAITSAVMPSEQGVVVAYEADQISPDEHLGWSVVITGVAQVVEHAADVARYEKQLRPWISQPMDQVIRIVPDIVTGYLLTDSIGDLSEV